MKCTACEVGHLINDYLETLLPCYSCDHCGGHWLYLDDYLRWLDNTEQSQSEDIAFHIIAHESKRVLQCPRTQTKMLKYRISPRTRHRLDLSSDVNGIWMDRGEWNLLKKENLDRRLNSIFTAPWQKKIRQHSAKNVIVEKYQQQFGEDGYTELKRIRQWLSKEDNRLEMLAYLLLDDPYSVNR